MQEENKVDTELVNVIETAIKESKSYAEAFDRVIKFKKEHRGLRGFHATFMDDFFRKEPIEDLNKELENRAHDILMMDLECAKGNCKRIDNPDCDCL